MLKTEQILNAKFTPVSKGTYSADEVDAFLKVVAESYDSVNSEKAELIKKISILADKLESYRNDEEAIKLALLDAHRMAETITKNAQIKSDTLIGDAETRAQLIVDGANRQSSKMIEDAREQAKELVEGARSAVNSLTERAQAETDATIAAAKEKAEQIVADAAAQSEKIVGESKSAYEFYTAEAARLQESAADFKASMAALCNDQLNLLASVPVIDAAPAVISEEADEAEEEIIVPVETETETAEDIPAEEPESELLFGQNLMAEIEDEIAAIESCDEVPDSDDEFDAPEEEIDEAAEVEQVVYVPEEPSSEDAPAEESDSIDDLFSLIDDMNFEDITDPDSIPSTLDDLVPQPAVAEETPDEGDEIAAQSDEEDSYGFEVEDDDDESDDADDDFFEGFKIDLDSIGDDDNDNDDEDDDITSLFDSMFDDE